VEGCVSELHGTYQGRIYRRHTSTTMPLNSLSPYTSPRYQSTLLLLENVPCWCFALTSSFPCTQSPWCSRSERSPYYSQSSLCFLMLPHGVIPSLVLWFRFQICVNHRILYLCFAKLRNVIYIPPKILFSNYMLLLLGTLWLPYFMSQRMFNNTCPSTRIPPNITAPAHPPNLV
jgi:hypothetical protein